MIQRMERRFVIRGAWNREIEHVFNRLSESSGDAVDGCRREMLHQTSFSTREMWEQELHAQDTSDGSSIPPDLVSVSIATEFGRASSMIRRGEK